tara:strand:- start:6328 stop:7980 length:1653 start_codon:yes stop_codon:yes gene_type:complete
MRKKRILFCTEATFLHTGYATYTEEVMKYLYGTGKYELAELGAYSYTGDPQSQTPWKFYGVMPHPEDEASLEKYKQSLRGQFGGYSFEQTCIDFKPDIVCDIRDFWMIEFIYKSPFRKFFKWALMPTVDAAPQAKEWMYAYSTADACFSYSDWSGEVLKNQSGGKINYLGSAPPSANPAYKPLDKELLKESFGIGKDTKIIGTVMRNQRRKLYPDLFAAFRKFLDLNDDSQKYKLYCHTSFPDAGWNIPDLLNEHNLCSHVLFTYVCSETKKCFASTFRGAKTVSPFTGTTTAQLSSVKQGLSYEQLAEVMNVFDLYVQYANSEGFGLPQVEAAACGVPVMSVDYSAMTSVVRQLGGTPLKTKALYKELETGCMRAVPDNDYTVSKLKEFFSKSDEERLQLSKNTREKFLENFQWDKTGQQWEKYFDSVDVIPEENTWLSFPNIQQPQPYNPDLEKIPIAEAVSWLYDNVLLDSEAKNSIDYTEMISNIMYEYTTSPIIGSFFDEDNSVLSFAKKIEQKIYSIKDAYDDLLSRRNFINSCEDTRKRAHNL